MLLRGQATHCVPPLPRSPLSAVRAAVLATFVVLGCGMGDGFRTNVAAQAGAAPGDPRFVGTGVVGPELPHWPMFRHDPTHSGRNGVARRAPPVLAWKFDTAGEVWSSPAIGIDGTVYVGSLDQR